MTLRSPIFAMLWELWRTTRAEAAWKLALGLGAALTVLVLFAAFEPSDSGSEHSMDLAAAIALMLIVMPHPFGWRSMATLTSGRLGSPLCLLYTRPVRTAVIVGLPLVYLTAVSSAVYLVSALLLRVTTGYAFPLMPVAAWIAAGTVVMVAATLSTRVRALQVSWMAFATAIPLFVVMERLTAVELEGGFDWPPHLWPTLFDFPLTDYPLMALIGLASFGVTVAIVGVQRHGGALADIPSTPGVGLRAWLTSLFRIPCPTSSATRAQVWFDLKFSGLPVLTIGLALAIVILLMGVVSNPIDAAIPIPSDFQANVSCPETGCFYGPARMMTVLLGAFSLFIMLFQGGNAFGIRSFEAAQAYGTAQLTALKLLVRSACFLAALIVVGVSAWTSASLMGDDVFIAMWSVPLSSLLSAITGAVAALTGYEQLALGVVAAVGVVTWVAAFAVLGALWTRYSRRVNIAASSLLLSGLALALLAGAERHGLVSPFVVDAIVAAGRWIILAAMVFTTVYVFWRGFAERVLMVRYACGALAISAAFAAAWLTMLQVAGVQLAGMPATNAVSMLSPMWLPLMAGVLAPWSLSRVRHT
jgi:hypothetical protein